MWVELSSCRNMRDLPLFISPNTNSFHVPLVIHVTAKSFMNFRCSLSRDLRCPALPCPFDWWLCVFADFLPEAIKNKSEWCNIKTTKKAIATPSLSSTHHCHCCWMAGFSRQDIVEFTLSRSCRVKKNRSENKSKLMHFANRTNRTQSQQFHSICQLQICFVKSCRLFV